MLFWIKTLKSKFPITDFILLYFIEGTNYSSFMVIWSVFWKTIIQSGGDLLLVKSYYYCWRYAIQDGLYGYDAYFGDFIFNKLVIWWVYLYS